ncbi:MAG: DUF2085 domain-containing protein [Candidatus Zixiibacteriota bacterium]
MKREIFPIQLQDPRPLSHNREYAHYPGKLAELLARWAERMGEKTFHLIKFHWLGIINFHLGLFIGGALLAPGFQYLDQGSVSKIIYGFFGLFCHQKESRCFFLLDHPVAICARCLSFYSSCLVFGIWMSLRKLKPIDLKLTILLFVPAIGDVLLQILLIKESTNLLRTTTGTLMGLTFAGYLIPRAQQSMCFLIQEDTKVLNE